MPTLAEFNRNARPDPALAGAQIAAQIAHLLKALAEISSGDRKLDRELNRQLKQLQIGRLEDLAEPTKTSAEADARLRQLEADFQTSTAENRRLRDELETLAARQGLEAGEQGLERGEVALGREEEAFLQERAKEDAEVARVVGAQAVQKLNDLRNQMTRAFPFLGNKQENREARSEFRKRLRDVGGAAIHLSPRVDQLVDAFQGQDETVRESRVLKATSAIATEWANQLDIYRNAIRKRNEILARVGRTPPDPDTLESDVSFIADQTNPSFGAPPEFSEAFTRVAITTLQKQGVKLTGPFNPDEDGSLGYAIDNPKDRGATGSFDQGVVRVFTRPRELRANLKALEVSQISAPAARQLIEETFRGMGLSPAEAERMAALVDPRLPDVFNKDKLSDMAQSLSEEIDVARGAGGELEAADFDSIQPAKELLQEARYHEFVRDRLGQQARESGFGDESLERAVQAVMEEGAPARAFAPPGTFEGDTTKFSPTLRSLFFEPFTFSPGAETATSRSEFDQRLPVKDFLREIRFGPPTPANLRALEQERSEEILRSVIPRDQEIEDQAPPADTAGDQGGLSGLLSPEGTSGTPLFAGAGQIPPELAIEIFEAGRERERALGGGQQQQAGEGELDLEAILSDQQNQMQMLQQLIAGGGQIGGPQQGPLGQIPADPFRSPQPAQPADDLLRQLFQGL